ncbi:pro-apoptotic serine protease [Thraustotheca clavata]|uniref:Pro-apoptotic serine protease n=1 Tax=Thraustotheca clavata TaxID=74557 RepID=A0A1V9ZWX6_9STRA|nr:pro-apoptotic serine protease [Thraustotheca clavata]
MLRTATRVQRGLLHGAARVQRRYVSKQASNRLMLEPNVQRNIGIGLIGGILWLGIAVKANSKQDDSLLESSKRIVEAEDIRPEVTWKQTLERVVPAIVSLKLNSPKSFDTESPGNGWATGFVVDAEKGIILTNRHVVGSGPVDAEAIFQNNEEVRVVPIYRDPVHDFGFFRYDPKDVRHIKVPSLQLCPEKACVGTDIRVVGNDAAEKLAIASGTLARLDRASPVYGYNSYNDFNTFYFQASSGTSGGSSGSPVLNSEGDAIALNAGGKLGTAASYYLPLDRVKRAFELLQADKPVPRGTIQTVFAHRPFDEVRRLGLPAATEANVRSVFPNANGMLVVSEVLPSSPCHDKLQPGDVLLKVNGKLLHEFVPLESVLDDSVNEIVNLELDRSGKTLEVQVQVQDLHDITPSRFLEVGGAVINPLSYQQARNLVLKPGAPYVADPGYFLQRSRIPKGALLLSVNGIATPDLDSLRDVLQACPDQSRLVVKYKNLRSKLDKVEVVHLDRRWFPFQEHTRDDSSGTWHCNNLDHTAPPKQEDQPVGSTSILPGKNFIEATLAPSLVTVEYDRPFSINSQNMSNYRGTGLILNAAKGLVVVDRNTVTDRLGDVMVTFANTLVVPGKVLYVHPVHNFAIVQYDPRHIGDTPVQSARVSRSPLQPSDPVWLVGLMSGVGRNSWSELVSRETLVSSVKWIALPLPSPPRYQENNLEMVQLQDVVNTEGGAVCTPSGSVAAFWASFSFQQPRGPSVVESQFTRGIPMDIIMDSVEPLLLGQESPNLFDLGVDFEHISLAKGRELGMDEGTAKALEVHTPEHRTILSVGRRWGGTDAAAQLRNGDVLVAIDNRIVTSFREVEIATQKPQVNATIVRQGKRMDVTLKTVKLESWEVDRIVCWQGLLLQVPPLSVASQREISSKDGVYVSCRYAGSPAARYGPPPTTRICELDGIPISNLDDFVRVVQEKTKNRNGDEQSIRVKYRDLGGKMHLTTLKLEPTFWPTSELRYKDGDWHRTNL